jgi:hypothetical protein
MKLARDCFREVNHKRIVFEEKRSKLTLINDNRKSCKRIEVDGCQITIGPRCDFALFTDQIECYIELKGQDINHALDQIIITMKALSIDLYAASKLCFIICSRVTFASAELQVMQAKFRKNYKAELIVQSSPFVYKIG